MSTAIATKTFADRIGRIEVSATMAITAAALKLKSIEHLVEARYAHQVWDLEIPLELARFAERIREAHCGGEGARPQ